MNLNIANLRDLEHICQIAESYFEKQYGLPVETTWIKRIAKYRQMLLAEIERVETMTEQELFRKWSDNEWKFGSSTDEAKALRAWAAARNAVEMPLEFREFAVDPARKDCPETGIFIRAFDSTAEKWISVDISRVTELTLLSWLRSRGGKNEWAEKTVALLLGHQST